MAFIADKKAYKEKLQTQSSNKATEKSFKKIAIPEGKTNNSDAQQEYAGPTIKKQTNSAWSL
jgi:hypothetical protein